MPASKSAQADPSTGIRICAPGRFVARIDCGLSVDFAAEAHWDTLTKRFESHLRNISCLLEDDTLSGKTITADAATSESLNHSDFDRSSAPMRALGIHTF